MVAVWLKVKTAVFSKAGKEGSLIGGVSCGKEKALATELRDLSSTGAPGIVRWAISPAKLRRLK
jgi:hypothetical protein